MIVSTSVNVADSMDGATMSVARIPSPVVDASFSPDPLTRTTVEGIPSGRPGFMPKLGGCVYVTSGVASVAWATGRANVMDVTGSWNVPAVMSPGMTGAVPATVQWLAAVEPVTGSENLTVSDVGVSSVAVIVSGTPKGIGVLSEAAWATGDGAVSVRAEPTARWYVLPDETGVSMSTVMKELRMCAAFEVITGEVRTGVPVPAATCVPSVAESCSVKAEAGGVLTGSLKATIERVGINKARVQDFRTEAVGGDISPVCSLACVHYARRRISRQRPVNVRADRLRA